MDFFVKIRWIFFQEQIFPSGFLSKIKYFMVEFFSRWIFQLESFKMDFFLRSDGFSFQVHIVNLTSRLKGESTFEGSFTDSNQAAAYQQLIDVSLSKYQMFSM